VRDILLAYHRDHQQSVPKHGKAAVTVLIGRLRTASTPSRQAILDALLASDVVAPHAIAEIRATLGDSNIEVRRKAMLLIRKWTATSKPG
jgi:hypothetical protein